MKRYIPILVTTVALVSACGQRQASEATTTETTSAAQSTGTGTTVTLTHEEREFMNKAALGGIYEIELGSQVQQKATNPEVRAFAESMVRDHTKLNDELKQLAAKKGFNVPTQLDHDHREDMDEILTRSGAELDKKYIDEMVDDHEDDVDEFRDAVDEAKDPEIRAWAEKTLRILEGHLVKAKELKERLGA